MWRNLLYWIALIFTCPEFTLGDFLTHHPFGAYSYQSNNGNTVSSLPSPNRAPFPLDLDSSSTPPFYFSTPNALLDSAIFSSKPSGKSLFTPAHSPYPAASFKQMVAYKESLNEIRDEELKSGLDGFLSPFEGSLSSGLF